MPYGKREASLRSGKPRTKAKERERIDLKGKGKRTDLKVGHYTDKRRPNYKKRGQLTGGATKSWELAAVAEIVVGLVEPVFAGRRENVQVEGVFESPGLVGHVGGDAQNFAGADNNFLAINGEFQRAF